MHYDNFKLKFSIFLLKKLNKKQTNIFIKFKIYKNWYLCVVFMYFYYIFYDKFYYYFAASIF